MILRDPNIVFIHQSKTAGSSISSLLRSNSVNGFDKNLINHHSLQAVVDNGYDLSEFQVVTSLRDPWSRVYSYYRMCYRPNALNFPHEWGSVLPRNRRVEFDEFVQKVNCSYRYMEDLIWYLSVNNKIYPHVRYLDFASISSEVKKWISEIGFSGKLPHYKKPHTYSCCIGPEVLNDPWYIDIIESRYAKELSHFFVD